MKKITFGDSVIQLGDGLAEVHVDASVIDQNIIHLKIGLQRNIKMEQ